MREIARRFIGFILFFGSWGLVAAIEYHGIVFCKLPFFLFMPLFLFAVIIITMGLGGGFMLMCMSEKNWQCPAVNEVVK